PVLLAGSESDRTLLGKSEGPAAGAQAPDAGGLTGSVDRCLCHGYRARHSGLVPSLRVSGRIHLKIAIGSAAGILELLGFLTPATQALGLVAAGVETLIAGLIEVRKRPVDEPLRSGMTGWAMLAAGTLAG